MCMRFLGMGIGHRQYTAAVPYNAPAVGVHEDALEEDDPDVDTPGGLIQDEEGEDELTEADLDDDGSGEGSDFDSDNDIGFDNF